MCRNEFKFWAKTCHRFKAMLRLYSRKTLIELSKALITPT